MTENTEMTSGEATESSEAETSWKEALPEDVREDPSMEAIQTVDNLAKSYVNAQKMIGADKIIVPNKYAEANEWKDVFTKLGLPESVDKYEISTKEEVDQEFLINLSKLLIPQVYSLTKLSNCLTGIMKLVRRWYRRIKRKLRLAKSKRWIA